MFKLLKGRKSAILFILSMIVIMLPKSVFAQTTPHQKIALRVPNLEVYNALLPYKDGTLGNISFIFYAGLPAVEELKNAGALNNPNPAELGLLVGCDENTPTTVDNNLNRYINAGITYLILDCEKGVDNLWGVPDVPLLMDQLAQIVSNSSYNFKIQAGMQYGYLEYRSNGVGGDQTVCTNLRDRSTCVFSQSYAGEVFTYYDTNDIAAFFGESGLQTTADEFEQNNIDWINYIKTNYPNNNFWGISGLVDKDATGLVDLNPQAAFEIAQRSEDLGATAFTVIWLGRTSEELFGPQTEMDVFLDLWADYVNQIPVPVHCSPLGDIDCSGQVGIVDIVSLLSVFGKQSADAGYNAKADLDDSGGIGIHDLSKLLSNFGKTN